MDHYTPIGIEIHQTYVGYVSAYFLQSFERYYKALSQLQSAAVDKTDLLGLDDSSKRGLFGGIKTVIVKDTSNIYGLADRLNILTGKDPGIILPDHAKETGKKFPYEAIFKSLTRLLIDNASSEYVFTCEFFSDPSPKKTTSQENLNSFFSQAFDPTMKFIEVCHYCPDQRFGSNFRCKIWKGSLEIICRKHIRRYWPLVLHPHQWPKLENNAKKAASASGSFLEFSQHNALAAISAHYGSPHW